MRVLAVGGRAAGRTAHMYGVKHKMRWRFAHQPPLASTGLTPGEVPASVEMDVEDYEAHQFMTEDRRPIFVLAPLGWTGRDIMGELLTSYQTAKVPA